MVTVPVEQASSFKKFMAISEQEAKAWYLYYLRVHHQHQYSKSSARVLCACRENLGEWIKVSHLLCKN
jgi:hypothetical protein